MNASLREAESGALSTEVKGLADGLSNVTASLGLGLLLNSAELRRTRTNQTGIQPW